ncbi:MAG: PPC domain-containing DNA-binding protein [Peptoniphilaceae bacterium]|nr:DNA-binding protein [Peptoniphilaceae bacterium]MCI6660689.1 DNA-binding protein [Peptoniphilaceae bacterium]MDD7433392.1 DNA-binding protein [Peptoniphilaceae bacterium]MDY3076158.1 PPC domain-containing DNA-binding protein [Peptoniphilaceae bacterium]MDY3986696.1 PPC domain-containing DNA-binding protein [Peptoniphilaceae bacterium]
MDYRRFGKKLICRFDRGEELVSSLQKIAEKENIKLAEVRALGATDDFEIGVYIVDRREYVKNHFTFPAEITNLWGTINTMDDRYYSHLHITVAGEDGHAYGGHLNSCKISATCEMIITEIEGRVDRYQDDVTGLNLFRFEGQAENE